MGEGARVAFPNLAWSTGRGGEFVISAVNTNRFGDSSSFRIRDGTSVPAWHYPMRALPRPWREPPVRSAHPSVVFTQWGSVAGNISCGAVTAAAVSHILLPVGRDPRPAAWSMTPLPR